MKDILDLIGLLGPSLSTVVVVLATLAATFKIFLQYKAEIAKKEPEQDAFRAQHVPQSLDNLSELLVQNFRILNSFYSESLSQYRTSSIASISIAVLGFVVIIAGVLIALIGNQVTLGSVSSAAGIVGEGAAVLFFKQNQTFQTQMEGSLKKLVSAQYLMTSIALARELDGENKVREVTQINDHLRRLMDGLHGLPSKVSA
jgi:Cyanobacterial TRADD-N associated 2-Transmembrane domain